MVLTACLVTPCGHHTPSGATALENANANLLSPEDIERELRSMSRATLGGTLRAEEFYRFDLLLGMLGEHFRRKHPGDKILGFKNFFDWAEANKERPLMGSWRRLLTHRDIGQQLLLPNRVSEADIRTFGHNKAYLLARIAKVGKLSPDIVKTALDDTLTYEALQEIAAPLLGKQAPWTERLRIDSHEAALAALLMLGNWLDFDTYTAHPGDANEDQNLGEIATLKKLPRFQTEKTMESVSKIDVIWIIEDEIPECFFEVEHSMDITRALHRMFQARGLRASFFIVARPDAPHASTARSRKRRSKAIRTSTTSAHTPNSRVCSEQPTNIRRSARPSSGNRGSCARLATLSRRKQGATAD